MTEKIYISKKLNEWLERYPKLDIDNESYYERFGREIFNELIEKVWINAGNTKAYNNTLSLFGLSGNSKVAHLWLLLNRDKWEVEKGKLFYICIPEPDGLNAYLSKNKGFQFSHELLDGEVYKWTQKEINKHEVAKYLQHFKKEV